MPADAPRPDWIAAAQDGQALTLWPMNGGRAGIPLRAELAGTGPQALASALRSALDHLPGGRTAPLLISGGGLVAPRPVPAAPGTLAPVPCSLDGLRLHALPGLCQSAPGGLMQGAETLLAGFFALNPDWDGSICLPGAVTHWVQASAREAVSFQSALTGGLAQAALTQAGLAGAGLTEASGWERAALEDAVADSIARPETLAARLAAAQADLALGQLAPEAAAGRIWGLLLGAELAAAKPYWLGQNAALIAGGEVRALYSAALSAQGLPFTSADPERLALEGLTQAWTRLQESGAAEQDGAGRLQ